MAADSVIIRKYCFLLIGFFLSFQNRSSCGEYKNYDCDGELYKISCSITVDLTGRDFGGLTLLCSKNIKDTLARDSISSWFSSLSECSAEVKVRPNASNYLVFDGSRHSFQRSWIMFALWNEDGRKDSKAGGISAGSHGHSETAKASSANPSLLRCV